MKRLIIPILLLSIFLFGCSNQTIKSENNNNNNNSNNESIEEKNTISLTDNDIEVINKKLSELTKSTAYENASFKIKMSEKNTNYLEISVIKSIKEYMSYFNISTADDTVKNLRKSLTFDTVYDSVKNSINKDFKGMMIYFYDNEELFNKNEFYTLKNISNK